MFLIIIKRAAMLILVTFELTPEVCNQMEATDAYEHYSSDPNNNVVTTIYFGIFLNKK